jgi:ribosomal protein L20
MSRRLRDYRAEYRRRKATKLAQGFSLSQARGHPKANEPPIRPSRQAKWDSKRLGRGLRKLRFNEGLTASAKAAGMSPERFRRAVERTGVGWKRGRKWVGDPDNFHRHMLMWSNEHGESVIEVSNLRTASIISKFFDSVNRFFDTNDISYVKPFDGTSVKDVRGNTYTFVTDANELWKLKFTGTHTYEQVYRIIVPGGFI